MDLRADLGESRTVTAPNGTIRIYERGVGDPIVFVHGLLANAAVWRKVVPALATHGRCITADWPFGAHDIPQNPDADLTPAGLAKSVADVIEELDLHNVTLVGNDGGGMLTQLVITTHPERISRVVLTSCDAYENFPPRVYAYLCWLAKVPVSFEILGILMRVPVLRRALGRSPIGFGWLSHRRIENELIDLYLKPALDRGVRRDLVKFLRSVDPSWTLNAAERFSNVDQPVLIAWSADDKVFPVQHARRFAADFRDSTLEIIGTARTWVPEDRPDEVASAIARFVGRDAITESQVATLHG